MADSESKGLSPLTPVPIAVLLCDQVISDETTKKKTVVGIFDRVASREFPTAHAPVSLYVRVTDAEGDYEFRIDYVQVETQQMLFQAVVGVQFLDRLSAGEFAVPLPPLVIPAPGEYEFRLWANGRYLHRVRFTALPLPPELR